MAFPMSSGGPSVGVLWCSTLKISLNFPKFSSSCASLEVSVHPTPACTCWVLSSICLVLFILYPCKVTGLLFGTWDTEIISVEENNFFSNFLFHISKRFLMLFRKQAVLAWSLGQPLEWMVNLGHLLGVPSASMTLLMPLGLAALAADGNIRGLTQELLPQEGKDDLFWSNNHEVPLALWTCAAKSLKPWT